MEPLKICIITQQYGNIWSGAGTYATLLIDSLAKKGHDVTVICPTDSVIEKKENINFLMVKKSKLDPPWLSISYNFSKKLKQLGKKRFDIIHFTDAREALFYSKSETPVVGSMLDYYFTVANKNPLYYKKYYNDWFKRYLYYNFGKAIERKTLFNLNVILPVCQHISNKLQIVYKIPANKLRVVYNGIDIEKFKASRKKYQKPDYPIILFIGTNFQRKGLPHLIKSSPQVIKELPTVQFYVIGKDPNAEILKKLCTTLNVENNFKFLGHIKYQDLPFYYEIADVFVMPSLIEGFATVFMEAMASGTPVIGGNVGCTKELINHGKNGFLVEKDDVDQLAAYILESVRDRDLKALLINEGYKTVENFNIQITVSNILNVYKDILKGKKIGYDTIDRCEQL